MTVAQLADTMKHAQALIDRKENVYAKEVSLVVGKQIGGLRAVFGEARDDLGWSL